MKYQFTHLNDVNTVHFDFWKAAGTCHIDGNSSLEILWWAFLKKEELKLFSLLGFVSFIQGKETTAKILH